VPLPHTPPPLAADPRLSEALAGAGMSVWEWFVESDRLSDMDEGTAMLGYAAGEVAPTQRAWTELIHPEDRAANEAAYERHVRGEAAVYEHEYRIRARDGSWRWMAERGCIVERSPDGRPLRMLGTQADITERRRAEGAALELAERLRKIARHVPGVVFQFRRAPDNGWRFPYIGERCRVLTGIAPELMVQDAGLLTRLIAPADRPSVYRAILRSARAMRPWHCEFRLQFADGALRWMRGSATPQRDDDGAVLWHGYLEDIGELRELEHARLARATAEAANRAKTEFLSRISHELRTPLNAVLGFSQMMEFDSSDPLSAHQQRRVALIREAGEHLLHMISDLLDLTRIDAGRLVLDPVAFDLTPLLRECADMLRPQAAAVGVRIEVEPHDPPLRIVADRRRLKQVLANLLSNAVKYNRADGWVRLGAEATQADVLLQVSDNGLGMTAHDQARLFEPFNRLAQERGAIEGSGIGLALSRGLVEAMGGRITVTSAPGAGSTFCVCLPAGRAPP
jgi:hypothetical protein